ncbi:MAG: ABC transporter permease [Thermoanaerobaculales bacterium]|jgi:putative ABC transport system permease protein|nr:ABC transporter permease [Thermoanaerobaculales bacterium]
MRRFDAAGESLRIALAALRANPARGVLTTLGIIIGIVAVATTMTAANGLASSFRDNVSVLGADVLYVSRMPWIFNGPFFQLRNRPRLTLKESDKLERALHSAVAVNPTAETQRPIQYQSETNENIRIVGTTDKQMLVSSAVPELGRFFTESDVQTRRRVCVIGATIHEQLFEGRDPLNKELRIGRDVFRVIGVMEKQGSAGFFGGPDFDSQVFIPITTFSKIFGDRFRDFNLAVKAPPGADLADFEYELIGEMRKIRRLEPGEDDDFAINKMDSLLDAFNNVMGVLLLIGMSVTGISLFVGGVGVMNIMFVSVTERTREIGIRKAIGAKRRAILQQFLFEAAAICLVGGAIGVALSFGVAEVIDRLLMPAKLSLPIVGLALAVAVLVGLIAGLIPAWRASRLNPIEALRYE